MKKTKKQKRFQFTQDKERPSQKDDLQVSRFISENKPYAQQEITEIVGDRYARFSEKRDQERDKKLVDNIQTSIERENSLSAIYDNIQVMANSGVVILEGSVFTEHERMMVEEKAAIYAGFRNVKNNLEVIGDN